MVCAARARPVVSRVDGLWDDPLDELASGSLADAVRSNRHVIRVTNMSSVQPNMSSVQLATLVIRATTMTSPCNRTRAQSQLRPPNWTPHLTSTFSYELKRMEEFVFRFNRRRSRSRGMVFYRVLELAVAHAPVRYRDLVADPQPKQTPPSPPGRRGHPPTMDRPRAARPWRAS